MKKRTVLFAVLLLCMLLTAFAEGEEPVAFGPGDIAVCEGFHEISGLYAEVLDDAALADGWLYFYTESCESPAEIRDWLPSDGNYTTVEVLFTVKNISDSPRTFGDKITACMYYRESIASQEVCFAGSVFQQNPGQIDEYGYMIMWSTDPVAIDPGTSTQVSFRFDIPEDVYHAIYAAATGEENGITETCLFTIDGISYEINLTQVLIPAGQSEF